MDFQGYFDVAFKNVKFEVLEEFKTTTFDLYDKMSTQISIPPSVSEDEAFYLNTLFSNIRNQISLDIQKNILNFIKKSSTMYFIDIMNVQNQSTDFDTYSSLLRKFVSQILRLNVKNIVSNGKILSEYIVDSPAFVNHSINNNLSNSTYIKYGKLSNINVYMDSFMRWSDDFILSYDDIYYDIKNLKLSIMQDSRFAPILNITYEYAFKVDNPGIIWVIEDLSSSGYNHYKSTLRDKKIDNLLDQ